MLVYYKSIQHKNTQMEEMHQSKNGGELQIVHAFSASTLPRFLVHPGSFPKSILVFVCFFLSFFLNEGFITLAWLFISSAFGDWFNLQSIYFLWRSEEWDWKVQFSNYLPSSLPWQLALIFSCFLKVISLA